MFMTHHVALPRRRTEEVTTHRPRYYQVKQEILASIAELCPGTSLAPERDLAERYATSRTTIRQALAELVTEGRLTRHQGRGTFVADPKVVQTLQLTSYSHDVRSSGHVSALRILATNTLEADSELSWRLGVEVGEPVQRLELLRFADATPMAVEGLHVNPKRFPELARHLAHYGSLYAALDQEYGVRPARATETIETAPCPPDEAGLLGTEVGAPMLLLSRHSHDAEGVPVEYVQALYRGDRYRFEATLRPPHEDEAQG
jgi:GntR family transcriptional regulator